MFRFSPDFERFFCECSQFVNNNGRGRYLVYSMTPVTSRQDPDIYYYYEYCFILKPKHFTQNVVTVASFLDKKILELYSSCTLKLIVEGFIFSGNSSYVLGLIIMVKFGFKLFNCLYF